MSRSPRVSPSRTPWVLGALGGAAVLALGILAATDLGDPIGATRARLAREAEAEARLLQDGWDELLGERASPAGALGTALTWNHAPLPAAPTKATDEPEPDAVGAAFLQLARDHQAGGRQAEAADALRQLAQQVPSGPLAWEGRLQAVRLALAFGGREALTEAVAELEEVPWAGTLQDSLRLRGVLAAAPGLADAERTRLGQQVLDALASGELYRGPGSDRVVLGSGGLAVAGDPAMGALHDLLEQRLPMPAGVWDGALGGAAAAGRSLLGELELDAESLTEGRWRLIGGPAAPEGTRLGLRVDPDGYAAVLMGEAELQERAEQQLDAGRGWTVASPGAIHAPAEAFGAPVVLEGIETPLRIAHRGPGALVRAERRRLETIRLALVLLAALIALVTWLGIRSLRNMARVAELRSHFVASVSHDLRTPLASISNLAENLEDGVVAGEHAVREYHGAIRREAARLGRIVNGLLDFASLERGQGVRVHPREVDVAAWIRDLESSARGYCRPHGVSLGIEQGPLPKAAVFDPDAVHRAVLNLVENAVRHSGESEVQLSFRAENQVLGVRVSDRGRGLPAAVKADLFEPYARGGESGGTGLGLTIVRRIAEAHGGTARVDSGPDGEGLVASFEIRLEAGGAA